jgi:hypothetical protein
MVILRELEEAVESELSALFSLRESATFMLGCTLLRPHPDNVIASVPLYQLSPMQELIIGVKTHIEP